VLAIVAGILVARHLKTTDDLFDSCSSPRTESLIADSNQMQCRLLVGALKLGWSLFPQRRPCILGAQHD
jgi:hypothetical protein